MSSRSRTPGSRGASRPLSAPETPDAGPQRSLALVAIRGGVAAVLLPLLAFLVIALVGWFLSDGGVHGSPRDALRVGALGWLMAHGSGVHVRGAEVSALPVGLTALVAYAVWRAGLRTGERLSGHGPDAYALTDGERDLTVPSGVAMFTGTYVVAAIVVAVLAGTVETQPSLGAVLLWSLVLAGGVGGAAIATGSGRAAVWLVAVPEAVREALTTAVRMLAGFLLVATVTFLVALLIDGGAALNVLSRLELDTGGAVAFVGASLLLVPNAVVFAGSYLLGPGFLVGAGTLVSPTVVALGPVPMFPLLAALPDTGPTPVWTPILIALPPLTAAVVVARRRHVRPTLDWDVAAVRGLSAGVLAGVMFAVLAALAGGSVGPGRMTEVGPLVASTLFHGIVAFGIGGLVGAVVGVWLTRRNPPPVPPAAATRRTPDEEPTVVVGRSGEKAAGTDADPAADGGEPTIPLLRRLLRRDETVADEGPDRG